jgi:hypothetical protein
MLKIATPISHLFLDRINAKKIIKYSDCLEVRENTLFLNYNNENLFHLDKDIIHPWGRDFKKKLKIILQKKKKIKLITFQASRCCDGHSVKNKMFQFSGNKFSRENMLRFAKNNIIWLKKNLKKNIKIGLENNNYYPSRAYKHVTNARFIKKIVDENKIFFLLDIAHSMITAHNKKIDFLKYLDSLPLSKAIQIHICCPSKNIKNNLLIDSHLCPNKKMLNLVIKILKKFRQIEYLTIEYYKDTKTLVSSIINLRNIINKYGL